MLGFFKKTHWKIEGKTYSFFLQIFKELPDEFQFITKGLENGVYRRFFVNHAMKGNFYTIGFDPLQSDKSMIKGKQFELKNIIIKKDEKELVLNVHIDEGLWIGFEFEGNILDFTDFQIDLSSLKVSNYWFENLKINEIVKGLFSDKLDLKNLNHIEIDGNNYYEIKDLEDGNYITIDEEGRIFELIHNPYKIELINESVIEFVDDVNNGKFDFDKYLKE